MRLIDAHRLIEELNEAQVEGDELYKGLGKAKVIVCYQPTVDTIERKKGKWIRNNNRTYSCSLCQSWIPNEQRYYANYCLFCGADMRVTE